MKASVKAFFAVTLWMAASVSVQADKWVGTWGTAPQLVEQNNLPPQPRLSGNSLRQIVQVSIGGETLRLKLSNEYSSGSTEVQSVEIARALSSGSSSDIDESTTTVVTFGGKKSVTIAAGEMVTSDAFAFALSPRQNVAITIHYGQCSNTNVTGHPGSRTTSYLATGNTNDFTQAVTTEHWYTISGIDVMAGDGARAVAILGNSITDGRGSTTNEQNRWADVFSCSLLDHAATKDVGVLNMGIGGNCVLAGGLGPTAVNRFNRDCLQQAGVKYIILFEGVNDLGSARNGEQTASNIIAAYKNMVNEAHRLGIWVYGATITPFKGNGYYSADHEAGRRMLNNWIRTGGVVDGVIDFDKIMRDPADTIALQSQYLYQNDWLHPNAQGYLDMGQSIDVNMFVRTDNPPYVDPKAGTEQVWIEAEDMIDKTVGTAFKVVESNEASGGKYLESVVNNTSLPTDPKCFLQTEFTTTQQARYYLYARVNCPSYDDDSYYVKVDNQAYSRVNGIMTNGQWQWLDLATFVDDGEKPVFMLSPGKHSLSIASRENGARLDRICISSYDQAPTGMGDDVSQASVPSLLRPAMADDGMAYTIQGYRQPYPQHGLFLIGNRKVLLR